MLTLAEPLMLNHFTVSARINRTDPGNGMNVTHYCVIHKLCITIRIVLCNTQIIYTMLHMHTRGRERNKHCRVRPN